MKTMRASERRRRRLEPLWMLGQTPAAPRHFPYHDHRTVAEVLADAAAFNPVMPELGVAPARDWIAEAEAEMGDETESQAKIGDDAQEDQTKHESCAEPVSRVAGGRSPAATSEIMDATAGETALGLVPAARTTTTAQQTAPGDVGSPGAEPLTDWQRVAAAYKAKMGAPAPRESKAWCRECRAMRTKSAIITCANAFCAMQANS